MDLYHHVKTVAVLLPAAAVCLAAFGAGEARGAGKTLLVEAGATARAHVPMSVELPEGTAQARMTLDGKAVLCQVAEGRLWWVLEDLPAGKSCSYTVEPGTAGPAGKGVELKQGDEQVDVTIDGEPFTSYVFLPKTIGTAVLRRPYFFPVLGPGQVEMMRPYPMVQEGLAKNVKTDHPHHTGLYVAHGEVNKVDDWSIGSKAGYIVHKGFESVAGGPVMGMLRETLDWTTVDKKPVMAETRVVRIYRQPDTARMIDLEIICQAKYGQVVFGDTKEGGMCSVRVRPELKVDGGDQGRLITSEGDEGKNAWGKKATWVDCSGVVDGKRLGLAMFDAPGNLRHPTTWHARTYGLVTANPFGLSQFLRGQKTNGDFTLEEGKSQTWRYRIYFHPGDEKEAKVTDRFADYASPPKATWK
ncbi:MAG TPA: PmoA family protein [Phycisphaerae bacterium]|nr:PmoA family protein [Phycisphaerae bacterium]